MKFYDVVDSIPNIPTSTNIKAIKIGEFRSPKKGEWFLSGAIPEAYLAKNDLTTKFNILKLVRTKNNTIIVEDFNG